MDSIQSIINTQTLMLDQLQSSINVILIIKDNENAVAVEQLNNKQERVQRIIYKLKLLKEERNKQKAVCKDLETQSTLLNQSAQRIESAQTYLSENGLLDQESRSIESEISSSNEVSRNEASSSCASYEYTPIDEPTHKSNWNLPIKPTKLKLSMLDIYPLTPEEFSVLPRYMLGRMTLDAINRFIEVINQAVISKYQFLSKAKTSLKTRDLQMLRDYKLQETADTKGKYFITEADIFKQQGKKNLDKNSYNLLTILRHAKRVYENRSGGTLKYILILS